MIEEKKIRSLKRECADVLNFEGAGAGDAKGATVNTWL